MRKFNKFRNLIFFLIILSILSIKIPRIKMGQTVNPIQFIIQSRINKLLEKEIRISA